MNYKFLNKIEIDKILILTQKMNMSELPNDNIIAANFQTKVWRKIQEWYRGGKHNECEKYQKNKLSIMLNIELLKTNDRINMRTKEIVNIAQPNKYENGFDYTENFDGIINKNDSTYYLNLKFVCDKGGVQTRTLREVYHFIEAQLIYLSTHNTTNIYFINILDVDTSYNHMDKFNYLINNKEYIHIKKYVFIGSLYEFQTNTIKLQLTL